MSSPSTRVNTPAGASRQTKAAASESLLQQAFNSTMLPNIITNIRNGKIINANTAACRLLGYSKKELLARRREDIFDSSKSSFKRMYRQRNTAGHARADLTGIKKNGKQFPCQATSVVFNGTNGSDHKAITTIVDMSQFVLKQQKIDAQKEKLAAANAALARSTSDMRQAEFKKWLRYMAVTSYDVMLDWDIASGGIYIGDSYEELFGYKVLKNTIRVKDWIQRIHPDERMSFETHLQKTLDSRNKKWEAAFRFIRRDGSVANATCRGIILRNADGKASRLIGALHDVTWQTELEERLHHEIASKEIAIADAVADAHANERSDIGKELHDNVNQLLVASGLYLGMAKKEGLNTSTYVGNALQCTKNAIEEIRSLTKRLVTDIINEFGLSEAMEKICKDTRELYPIKVLCSMGNFTENNVKNKFKLNLFRIIQEQLNNTLKHAKASTIRIELSQTNTVIVLYISDDGVGFDTTLKRKGIGILNIKSRAAYYLGKASFVSEPGKGCALTVTFPITDALLNNGMA